MLDCIVSEGCGGIPPALLRDAAAARDVVHALLPSPPNQVVPCHDLERRIALAGPAQRPSWIGAEPVRRERLNTTQSETIRNRARVNLRVSTQGRALPCNEPRWLQHAIDTQSASWGLSAPATHGTSMGCAERQHLGRGWPAAVGATGGEVPYPRAHSAGSAVCWSGCVREVGPRLSR